MYRTSASAEVAGLAERPWLRRLGLAEVGPTVWLLGVTSLLTDVSAEMVTAVLPLYIVFQLGLTPFSFGVVDGIDQGGAVVFALVAGLAADRLRSHKGVAFAGYLASSLSKLGLLAVGGSTAGLAAFTALDRFGKGIRTSPRDALIARSVPHALLGTAFGVHRALDTGGAMLGPIVASALLYFLPGAYDAVFVVSFAFSLLGMGVLVAFVRERELPAPTPAAMPAMRLSALAGDPSLRRLLLAVALLGAVTLSDGFVYLALQRRLEFEPKRLPLLFVATPAAYLCLAVPFGRLADRVGRARLVLFGYVLLLAAYLVVLAAPEAQPAASLALVVLLLGGYYAATDGVTMALASATLPRELTASGLGLVSMASGLGKLVGSLVFGVLFSRFEPKLALAPFAAGLGLAWLVARRLLLERGQPRFGA